MLSSCSNESQILRKMLVNLHFLRAIICNWEIGKYFTLCRMVRSWGSSSHFGETAEERSIKDYEEQIGKNIVHCLHQSVNVSSSNIYYEMIYIEIFSEFWKSVNVKLILTAGTDRVKLVNWLKHPLPACCIFENSGFIKATNLGNNSKYSKQMIKTSQELWMLSRSLCDYKSLAHNVMIQVSQFVINSQLCH